MEHDVFISFSFHDQLKAEEIANRLTSQYGISCWICTRDAVGGSHFRGLIIDAIDAAKVVVFIQSVSAVKSKEIPREIDRAFEGEKTIIPFKLDESHPVGDLRYPLQGIEYIDGTKQPFEERIYDLARSINKALGKDQTEQEQNRCTLRSTTITFSDIFLGRDPLLTKIHTSFEDGNRIIFLKGMGGIGKTELARQYVRKYRNCYDTTVFARYDDSLVALLADDEQLFLTGINRKIKENGEVQSDDEYADLKLKLIANNTNQRTLIIIDNYDVTFDPYYERLASLGQFRILFTTRCDQDTKNKQVIFVGELSDEDLKEFMVECCEREYTHIESNDPGFDQLFAITGRHTLTLELIAKYMCENSIDSVGEMVEILLKHGFLLYENVSNFRKSSIPSLSSIINSLFRITSLTAQEQEFLRFLALMPATGIKQVYFKRWCSDVYSIARLRLLKLSLVQYDPNERKLMLHPIIRQVIHENFSFSYDQCKKLLIEIDRDIEENVAWNYPFCQKKELAHCCISVMEGLGAVDKDNYSHWYNMAVFLNFTEEYADCMQRLLNLYDFAVTQYGFGSLQEIRILFRLGWLSLNRMHLNDALNYLERALLKFDKFKTQAASDYIHCLCDCSNALHLRYRESKEETFLSKAVDYANKAYSFAQVAVRDHLCQDADIRLALSASTLSKCYVVQKDYLMAAEKLEEAYVLLSSGGNHLDVASVMAKRAIIQHHLHNSAAKQTLIKAIALYETYGVKASTTYLDALRTMANWFENEMEMDKAISFCRKALDYALTIYEEDHYVVIQIRKHLYALTEHTTSDDSE